MQSVMDEEFTARPIAPVLPRAGCDTAQVLEYISQQLDCFAREPLLLGRYQLLGPRHRCAGGAFFISCSLCPARYPSILLFSVCWALLFGF